MLQAPWNARRKESSAASVGYKRQVLNERMAEYADFAYDEAEPGFQMKRRVGEHVTAVMGDRDKKWVTDQIMEIEIPDALKTFKKVARNLI